METKKNMVLFVTHSQTPSLNNKHDIYHITLPLAEMNLLELIKNQISSSDVQEISKFIGEDSSKVTSGLASALPALLAGFMQKASTTQGATDLLTMIKNDNKSESVLGNLSGLLSGGNSAGLLSIGSGILSSLFGDKASSLTSVLSKSSGLGDSAMSSLMSIASPVILGVLGRQVSTQGLGVSGLASMLMGQKDFVKAALPAGLGSIMNVGALGDFLGDKKNAAVEAVEEEVKSGSSFLPWLLLAILLFGGLYFWKSCRNKAIETTENAVDTTVEKVEETVGSIHKTLSTGVDLNFGSLSIENELITFIEDNSKAVDKETWFNFRNLTFETGSAVIDAQSEKEVDNIAEILKAYPNVNLKIGGYTDNTGSDELNIKLSGERAASVVKGLEKRGIDASRLTSEGYGPQHPVASNDTEEGKAQNRRIAVRVTKK